MTEKQKLNAKDENLCQQSPFRVREWSRCLLMSVIYKRLFISAFENKRARRQLFSGMQQSMSDKNLLPWFCMKNSFLITPTTGK
jgi:hypothetical protein